MNSGRHGMREPPSSLLTKPVHIKVLRWDKHGVWLCTRRLHKGSFRWPRANDAAWHLTPDEFNWLTAGVDWQQVKGHDLTKWVWQNEPELRPENTQNTLLTQ